MSAKNKDDKNRWRNKNVGFRCSPEEGIEIDKRWKMCGFRTKQDYILECLLHPYLIARGNPMMLISIRKELKEISVELSRIDDASEIDEELFTPIRTMLEILESFKLVIDNDPQGSLTEALGYPEPDKLEITLATIMEWVLNEEEFDLEAGILHHEEGIDLLPANIELSGVETSLIGIMSSESMERKKAHYLRDIIREEELMKYASKAGVTSFQKSVVKTYMKGINESQLAAKYDVTTNAIHEAIYGYVTTCRRYVGKQTNSRKLQWIERVEPEEDFLENILKGKNKGQNAAKEALVEASRVSVNKSLLLLKQNANNPDKQKQLINQLRIVFNTSGALFGYY